METESKGVTYVQKACAYITRDGREQRDGRQPGDGRELLVFEGPEHDGLQVPKGTVEADEGPSTAVLREIAEESGLGAVGPTQHLTTDVWTRRRSPPRRYVRHFYHATVHDPRERWTHTVTGAGEERGLEYVYSWIELPTTREFALALDDHLDLLE